MWQRPMRVIVARSNYFILSKCKSNIPKTRESFKQSSKTLLANDLAGWQPATTAWRPLEAYAATYASVLQEAAER
jgi:phage-related minor tail protein